MTHKELLALIERMMNHDAIFMKDALRAIVELHEPWVGGCSQCVAIDGGYKPYPCPTIQAIEKELQ